MPKIIIRVEERFKSKLEENQAFRQSVIKEAGLEKSEHDVDIEFQSIEETSRYDYKTTKRLEQIQNAFETYIRKGSGLSYLNQDFLIGFSNNKLREYLEHLEQINPPSDLKQYQALIDNYLENSINLLRSKANLTEKEAMEAIDKGDEYSIASQERPVTATLISKVSKDGDFLMLMDIPQDPSSEKHKSQYEQARSKNEAEHPAWRKAMSSIESKLFKSTPEIKFISSKLRTIPGVANYLKHRRVEISDDGGVKHTYKDRYSSSITGSRDTKKSDLETRAEISDDNMQHKIDTFINTTLTARLTEEANQADFDFNQTIKVPILMQSLITPLPFKEPDVSLIKDKNNSVEKMKKLLKGNEYKTVKVKVNGQEKTINVKYTLFNTNHPLNPGRFITGTRDRRLLTGKLTERKKASKILIKKAREVYKESKKVYDGEEQQKGENNKILLVAADLFEEAIDSSSVTPALSESNQRELYLASMEQIIVSELGGLADGFCISGKDRKGLEKVHTAAMEKYFKEYGSLPKYKDTPENRQNFLNLFAKVYVSEHSHAIAGQNAPGANGIKTPRIYLTDDMLAAIEKEYAAQNNEGIDAKTIHKDTNRIASNNELGKLYKKKHIKGWKNKIRRFLNRLLGNDKTQKIGQEFDGFKERLKSLQSDQTDPKTDSESFKSSVTKMSQQMNDNLSEEELKELMENPIDENDMKKIKSQGKEENSEEGKEQQQDDGQIDNEENKGNEEEKKEEQQQDDNADSNGSFHP